MTRLKTLRPRLAPAPARGWAPDTVRGSRQARGYGAEWERLREEVMRRDERLCQPCLKAGRVTPGTECDHIVPKSQGGKDELSNLQSICSTCHRAKTSQETRGPR